MRRVANNFPCNFLIADEVGLGKTIETGLILKYLLTSQKVQRVLLLVPASVQNQWQQELREKFNLMVSSIEIFPLELSVIKSPSIRRSQKLRELDW